VPKIVLPRFPALLLVLLPPVFARAESVDSTLMLVGEFGGARMTAAATVIDTEEKWAVAAYHFTRQVRASVAVAPLRDDRRQLLTEPEPYWQRVNRHDTLGVTTRWVSKADDLALLEIANLPPTAKSVPLASRPSETTSAHTLIGHPMSRGTCFEVSTARLIASERMSWKWTEQAIDSRFLRLEGDAPFPSGYSGGPVLNAEGELAGMVVASPAKTGNAVLATDAERIRAFLHRVYLAEAWKSFASGDTATARRRVQKASDLEPNSLLAHFSKWAIDRPE
jgi:S1-C subfamily serine protease